MGNWGFGVCSGYATDYFETEQEAKWFFLLQRGLNKNAFVFKKVDGCYQKVQWSICKTLNERTAPFKVTTKFKTHLFYKEEDAIAKYWSLKAHKIEAKLQLNINGFDFAETTPNKIYSTLQSKGREK